MERDVNIDKEILGGTPVFRGTRVPVKNLFDYLETNASIDDFLQDFESVDRKQVVRILELSKNLIETSHLLLYEDTIG